MRSPHCFGERLACWSTWGLALLTVGSVGRPAVAAEGSELLEQAGVSGGLVVHLGCGGGVVTAQLRGGDAYIVQGLATSEADIATARRRLIREGVYGPVSVDTWDGKHLPYADNLVNLIVAEDAAQASDEELLRALAPGGVLLKQQDDEQDDEWQKTVKPRPAGMDEWTHYLHDSDGNPVAQDSVVGPPDQVQWLGSPRWSRHHDHMASLNAMVSAGGRVFYIFDEGPTASIQLPSRWRLIARDAFNGVILWKRDIQRWNTRQYPLKSGPADLLRRLVAVGDRVYVTLGIDSPATVLDAATGETLMTCEGSQYAREIVVSDGVVFVVADSSPSRLPDWRRVSTYVWDNTNTANPGWGWKGNTRKILAYDADSGHLLWKTEAPVAPCSLAVNASRAVFHDGAKLVCLDRRTGGVLWEGEPAEMSLPVNTNTGPRVLIYGDVVLLAANNGKMSGWSMQDGRKLWEQNKKPSGHNSLKDLMVVDGLSWTAAIASSDQDGTFLGYDPRTGQKKREFPADVHIHWFHHRCYPAKATGDYILTARNGTEFVDLNSEHWAPHHWVRGGCIYGVMPCNGLLYAPMDSCGCQLEAKLAGLKSLASSASRRPGPDPASLPPRLQKGPAFGRAEGPAVASSDWPTYRRDEGRSGATPEEVSARLGAAWRTDLGGRLSPPTVAAGKVFVAAVDSHAVHALDAQTGDRLWSFTAGGRVDSPPTYYKGLVLFGSVDGYVYALRASDGELAWRFRGAPIDRRVMAWEQLESAWPVHGAVLVHDGVLYCTAGRNMFLDGGIHFLRLDPATGELLGEVVMDDKDPETGEEMQLAYLKKTRGNNMPVALADVLSCDGRNIWMRSQKIEFDGTRREIGLEDVNLQPADDSHLFCQIGMLDDSYFFRSYWTYGRRVTGGYGGWFQAGRLVPSGRILCFDEDHVFGFGRKPEFMTNSSVLQYEIFSADKAVSPEAIDRVGKANSAIGSRSTKRNANSSDWLVRHFFPTADLTAARFQWTVDQPAVLARAMVAAGDALFVAGPPDVIDERFAYRQPDNSEVIAKLQRQQEALEGRHGGQLWVLAKSDGRILSRYELDTIPVFDGMAAAGGRLYISTVEGDVRCLGAAAAAGLKTIEGQPETIEWDQPEDPGYLLPPEEPREGDFDRVARCKVVASKLGYRLQAQGENRIGVALKKLDSPITGAAALKTRMSVPADTRGLLRNGFLAFGDGSAEDRLIKCGAKLKLQQALLAQGPLTSGPKETASIDVPDGQPFDVVVTVDLDQQIVTCEVAGVKLEAPLERPLKTVNFVGYVVDRALADFAPIEIERH